MPKSILWPTCVSNPSMRMVGVIRTHVVSRDEKGWNARGEGGGETKQKKLQTVQIAAVGLHLHFRSHYLKKQEKQRRRGQECLSK